MQTGQYVVVKHAASAAVDHLAFLKSLTLERHQTARHFSARSRIDQPLAGRTRYFDLFLRVEAAIALLAEQERADKTALAPERHGPHGASVERRVER